MSEMGKDSARLNNMGVAALERNDIKSADGFFTQAKIMNPLCADAVSNLGYVRKLQGQLDEAQAYLKTALELNERCFEAHATYGDIALDTSKIRTALERYAAGITIARNCDTWNDAVFDCMVGASTCAFMLGQEDLAKAMLEDVLCMTKGTKYVSAHNMYAKILEAEGDFGRATELFEYILSIDDGDCDALASYAARKKGKTEDKYLEKLREVAGSDDYGPNAQSVSSFALAKVCSARRQYAAASRHLDAGNSKRLEYLGKTFNKEKLQERADKTISKYTADYIKGRSSGYRKRQVIFIYGMPRSGTTLIEQILSSHPKVVAGGERVWGKNSSLIFDSADTLSARTCAQNYINSAQNDGVQGPTITDKTPSSIERLGALQCMFPGARFLHCRRDLRDVALSCYTQNFREIRWANSQEDILEYIKCYLKLTKHWEEVLPEKTMNITYEGVVQYPNDWTKSILGYCGLRWHSGCLKPEENAGIVRTASIEQVRQPVYTTSIGKWKLFPEWSDWFRRIDDEQQRYRTGGTEHEA